MLRFRETIVPTGGGSFLFTISASDAVQTERGHTSPSEALVRDLTSDRELPPSGHDVGPHRLRLYRDRLGGCDFGRIDLGRVDLGGLRLGWVDLRGRRLGRVDLG